MAAQTLALSAQATGRAAVAAAAQANDVEAVRALLKQGGDVNGAQGDGMTALHWAAHNGNAAIASMLLYGGANPKATTRLGGYMPVHLAAQAGAAGVIEELAKAGAVIDAPTTTGATALMLAARSGSVDAVRALAGGRREDRRHREGARRNRADVCRRRRSGAGRCAAARERRQCHAGDADHRSCGADGRARRRGAAAISAAAAARGCPPGRTTARLPAASRAVRGQLPPPRHRPGRPTWPG